MHYCEAAPLRGSAYNLPSKSPPIVLTLLEAALILPSPMLSHRRQESRP